ncbi:MAG TPA: phosphotransferase [Phenylobacterium sp.]
MVAIPHAVEDIDAEWLRASVGRDDAAAFDNLVSVAAERLGEGVAISASIHRLSLGYTPGARRGPANLVVKTPSAGPAVRAVAFGWSTYRREVLFYREVAATLDLRIPKTYVAEHDPQTGRFVLVMEDLSHATDGDQVAGLPLEHAKMALEEIAALHARWWNRPELRALEATIQPFGQGLWAGSGARHAAAWPAFEAFVSARASPELLGVGERLGVALDRMMVDMAAEPRTLCHGDFRADNLMFVPGEGPRRLITVDWQAPMQARGAFDVAMLMSMSVTTELRRAHQEDLLRGYYERLLAGGVQGYAYDEFFQDYRRGLAIGFTYVVQGGPAADMSNPRTLALFDSAVRRLDATIHDYGLSEFVR